MTTMTTMTTKEWLAELDEDILTADGFDDALIGIGERCGQPIVAVYDRDKCIDVLVRQGLSAEEAVEHFEFNLVGAWVGERTPLFLVRPPEDP